MSENSLSVNAALALIDGLSLAGTLVVLPHDPDNPPKPSPIDPVIRDALNWRFTGRPFPQPWGLASGPYPEAWLLALNRGQSLGPVPDPWLLAGLNPQPLPPISIAAALVARAELIADASDPDAAASYVQQIVDELCPPPRVIKLPPKGPWPPSEPWPILALSVSPSDLVLFAGALRSFAPSTSHERLTMALEAGAMRAAEQGIRELNESLQ